MKTFKPILSFILFSLLIGLYNYHCSRRSEYKELDEDEFVQVYCDAVIYADLVESRLRKAFVDSVLESYQIKPEDFQYTISSYSKNVEKWESVFEKIVAELERREKEMTTKGDSTKM